MARQISTLLPDIDPATHFIGLCGVNNWVDEEGQKACDPKRDGWMISDFYLLNHLFRGLGRSQAWFTCQDPHVIINDYKEYAHGNPYGTRRVVLDKNQIPDEQTLYAIDAIYLRDRFLDYLKAQCRIANEAGEPVLLCLHAHGDELQYGIEVGGDKQYDNPQLEITHVSAILAENPGLQMTILMFSCFSGGWATSKVLAHEDGRHHATVIAPAGMHEESESWNIGTLGRCCGSLYMSALLNSLESATGPNGDPIEGCCQQEDSKGRVMSTKQFAATIKAQLLNVIDPRHGHVHKIQFQVQDGKWDDPYPQRTGIPLSCYHERLEELRTISPRELISARANRSLTEEDCEAWEIEHPDALEMSFVQSLAATNFGGSMRAVETMIRKQAVIYMKSKPGRDSLADNHRPHAMIWDVIRQPQLVSYNVWKYVLDVLIYRLQSLDLAEGLVRKIGLRPERALTWDSDEWAKLNSENDQLYGRVGFYRRKILELDLIPAPEKGANKYQKPVMFLAVALAESGLSEVELDSRLGLLKQAVTNTVDECAELIQKRLTLRKRTNQWIATIKERARSLFPNKNKRRSIRSAPSTPTSKTMKRLSDAFSGPRFSPTEGKGRQKFESEE